VGLMIDANVFIQCERRGLTVDISKWKAYDGVFISAVSVSELLMGVHRADNDVRRKRRSEFVEAILAGVSVLDFTTAVARRHAELCADLARRGQPVGAHDAIIAATALHHGCFLLTDNVDEFSRVSGLKLISFGES
jgi:tRNA(fMet)-specific endonuclease VapC